MASWVGWLSWLICLFIAPKQPCPILVTNTPTNGTEYLQSKKLLFSCLKVNGLLYAIFYFLLYACTQQNIFCIWIREFTVALS